MNLTVSQTRCNHCEKRQRLREKYEGKCRNCFLAHKIVFEYRGKFKDE